MQLVTYFKSDQVNRLGVIHQDLVVDVERLAQAYSIKLPHTMLEFIDDSVTAQPALKRLLESSAGSFPHGTAWPRDNVTLAAPIPKPRKNIFGIGLNYRSHVDESAKSLDTDPNLPKQPVVFSKPPTAVIGPGQSIHHDKQVTQQLDWEVELAVIIGSTARKVPIESAMRYVFGYSVLIDISARDNRRAGQWLISKGMDTYAPFGPILVTADEFTAPQNAVLWLKKNGELKQHSNTSHMIFNIAYLIADLSRVLTLEPGDIIATGTPEGVGAGRIPQEWLWPGDVVEAGIEGIGVLRHPVVAI